MLYSTAIKMLWTVLAAGSPAGYQLNEPESTVCQNGNSLKPAYVFRSCILNTVTLTNLRKPKAHNRTKKKERRTKKTALLGRMPNLVKGDFTDEGMAIVMKTRQHQNCTRIREM